MEYWKNIVLLRLNGSAAGALSVRNSRDAATILLKAWPNRNGKSYRRAILNCSAAIHGRVPQDLAQWAFIVAAMEAAIPYEIVDAFDAEIGSICRQLLEEEGLPYTVEAIPGDGDSATPPFWWSKRPASGPSAR